MAVIWRVDKEKLRVGFRYEVNKLLEESPYTWVVLSGYRSLEEQQVLWEKYKAGGPRAAPPGKSAHNFGLAVDVVLDGDPEKVGLQPDWNTSHPGWQWLFEAIAAHPDLYSGRSFNDASHIEKHGWDPARLSRKPMPVSRRSKPREP